MSSAESYGDPETRGRILDATWRLVTEHGSSLKLTDVAAAAGVSRQSVYLHFGDRSGLFVALVQHMDQVLELDAHLQEVFAAPTSAVLLESTLRLNTMFWDTVAPVAQVLAAAQHEDEALAAAWRDRLELRRMTFGGIVQRIADAGDLVEGWSVETATALLYAVAAFEPWRELTHEMRWSHDAYVQEMTRFVTSSFLGH